ncbi:macro domain-containing protein [bacterium]|nr:macro domain-containing protein [bacterium]
MKVFVGDIFDSKMQTLVNTVNCAGVMGKGIAKEFKRRYPDMFEEYKNLCEAKEIKLGQLTIYDAKDIFSYNKILNFPTKDHWKSPSKLTDIVTGLDYFIENYQKWNITSIAFPPLGCGNGGLKWSYVGKIMYQKLYTLPIDIEIYAPFGTPLKELSQEYLMSPFNDKSEGNFNNPTNQIKQEWVPLLECVYQLQENIYSPKVGRIKFQKIAYILTELGVQTGLEFKQKSFGPFSDDLKQVINTFSNSNLIIEEEFGRMLQMKVSDEYLTFRKKHLSYLKKHEKKIMKTTSLFERIKTTEKAEEVTSIIFVIREMKKKQEKVSDLDVLNALLSWKKRWDEPEKKESLVNSIKNLAVLRWIDINFSQELTNYDLF